jgi:uncharacterized membrane protein
MRNDNENVFENPLIRNKKRRKRQSINTIFRWLLAILVFIASPIFLLIYPTSYTPIVSIMFSIFLFLLAHWIGFNEEIEKVAKLSNRKWLPQAESVIYRLLTLHSNVTRFALSTNQSCSNNIADLPELETEAFKTVKVRFKTRCEAHGQRLEDIARQLDDAIEDWKRFVAENCDGDECIRIYAAIEERKRNLENDLINNKA